MIGSPSHGYNASGHVVPHDRQQPRSTGWAKPTQVGPDPDVGRAHGAAPVRRVVQQLVVGRGPRVREAVAVQHPDVVRADARLHEQVAVGLVRAGRVAGGRLGAALRVVMDGSGVPARPGAGRGGGGGGGALLAQQGLQLGSGAVLGTRGQTRDKAP